MLTPFVDIAAVIHMLKHTYYMKSEISDFFKHRCSSKPGIKQNEISLKSGIQSSIKKFDHYFRLVFSGFCFSLIRGFSVINGLRFVDTVLIIGRRHESEVYRNIGISVSPQKSKIGETFLEYMIYVVVYLGHQLHGFATVTRYC